MVLRCSHKINPWCFVYLILYCFKNCDLHFLIEFVLVVCEFPNRFVGYWEDCHKAVNGNVSRQPNCSDRHGHRNEAVLNALEICGEWIYAGVPVRIRFTRRLSSP